MQTLVANCPHCGAEGVGLELHGQSFVQDQNYAWMHCHNCFKPVVAKMAHAHGGKSLMPNVIQVTPKYNGWFIAEMWPAPPQPNIPDHLPEKVAKPFRQAEDNYYREGQEETAGGSYGRTLDVATKQMAPDFKGMLSGRIKHLAATGRITQDLADWAHDIRVIRNDALHEIDGITREELTHLRGLTDMLLRYLFTLPAMIKARKAQADAAK